MADRNYRSQYDNRQQDYDQRYNRQSEQFSRYNDDQYEDGGYRSQDRMGYRSQSNSGQSSYNRQPQQYSDYSQSSYRSNDYDPLGDYDRASSSNRGYTSYDNDREHQFFRPDDFGGEDYSRGSYGATRSNYGSRSYGQQGYGQRGSYGNRNDRGFFEKAGDEIASWFGDDDAERRRDMDHRGRGPSNYQRSNERLLEDACERLTHDRYINASGINVTADNNEITLDGTVDSRQAKRRAEDCMHDIAGVKHVQNNLRVDSDLSTSSSYETSVANERTVTSETAVS